MCPRHPQTSPSPHSHVRPQNSVLKIVKPAATNAASVVLLALEAALMFLSCLLDILLSFRQWKLFHYIVPGPFIVLDIAPSAI